MSTLSSITPLSGPSAANPLYLLACVAAQVEHSTTTDTNSTSRASRKPQVVRPLRSSMRLSERKYIPCSQSSDSEDGESFTRSSISPTPTLVELENQSIASSNGSPISYKTRKACHRPPKATDAQKSARAAREPRRKEVLARALRIKTVENSPVNDQQLRVLRMVFDEITKYPKDHWIAIIAVVIHRSFAQVKHWFSNERQKNKSGESLDWVNDVGEKIRVRPMAIELCEDWTDDFFEDVVMVFNFKSRRLLQWVD